MSTRNKGLLIFVFLFLFYLLQDASCQNNDKILEVLNGTWVDDQHYLKSQSVHQYKYGWGNGKRIVETTLEIDLVQKVLQIPGGGRWNVEQTKVMSSETIQLLIRSFGGVRAEKTMTLHLLSCDQLWIEPPSPHEFLSVGKENTWYRLSGPSRP
jgi:hypothetical protein